MENLNSVTPNELLNANIADNLAFAIDNGEKLAIGTEDFHFYGVVTSIRRMGKLAFGKCLSTLGAVQFVVRQNELGEGFKDIVSNIKLGSHIKFSGKNCLTGTKENSILCNELVILKDAQMSFPDKWNGVSDEEKRRLRYQDCLVDHEKHNLFIKRNKFISSIRNFLSSNNFLEVETPILHKVSAGAQANPFVTSCRSMNDDFYLRIAPETYLKRMTAAGFHNVFEIGKQFRNEGIDPSHMPEFTSCEWYCSYSTANEQMSLFIELLCHLHNNGFELGVNPNEIPVYDFEDAFNKFVPNFSLEETPVEQIDALFKQYVRPTLTGPCFIVNYPAHVAPLAKRQEGNPNKVDMWQFVWKTQEIVKCYSELVDPVEQRKLLEGQMEARDKGDSEAMMLDENFLETMQFGMPEQAGVGVGIDRLFALYQGVDDIRDVVFFPLGY